MSTPRTASIQPQVQHAADAANRLADSAEQTVNGVRERVIPAAVRLANQAEDLAHRGYDAVPNVPEMAFHFVDAAIWPAVQQQGRCCAD